MSERFPSKQDSLRRLRRFGLPVGCVIDVGVERATPDLIAVFPDKPHLLIEPVAAFRPEIERAYADIDHELVVGAVGDCDGQSSLATSAKGRPGTITHSQLVSEPSGESVEVHRLDTLTARSRFSGPYLLKIDVDGHEPAVLAGAEATLKETSCVLIESPLRDIVGRSAILSQAGFELWDIVDLCYYDGALWQVDLIWLNPAHFEAPGRTPDIGRIDAQIWQPLAREPIRLRVKRRLAIALASLGRAFRPER